MKQQFECKLRGMTYAVTNHFIASFNCKAVSGMRDRRFVVDPKQEYIQTNKKY